MGWVVLLWGVATFVHGAALAINLRGYADKWLLWTTGGMDRQPVQHFNASTGQWRTGRAGLVLSVGMVRAIGGVLAVVGAVVLILGLRMLF